MSIATPARAASANGSSSATGSGMTEPGLEVKAGTKLSMRRLPFTLHDFTRISWVGNAAREMWEPRITRITTAWLEIEWRAIVAGARSCCITMVTPEQYLERGPKWAEQGLATLPIGLAGGTSGYSNTVAAPEYGKPFAFRMVLGSPASVTAFKKAWDRSDDRAIGALLGYPACCRDFYKQVWVDEGLVDTTWPMAVASTPSDSPDRTLIEVSGPPRSNILWRWMGVRAVPHLPCSFTCPATIEFADRLVAIGREHGFDEEMDWMSQILDWPVEWTALHGIAEIKTPIMKVSTRTDATPCKYTVHFKGRNIPAEGARGLRFPFAVHSLPILTESTGFKRGLQNPIAPQRPNPLWYAADNGFSTVTEMERAHEPIVKAATSGLAGSSGNVLDLGCGNGALLKRILEANPSIVPFGIDIDASRIGHARELLPRFSANVVAGNLFETESIWPEGRKYQLALLMPGRLLEVPADQAARFLARLGERCERILVYAYGDWLKRHGTLRELAAAAGMDLAETGEAASVGFAVAAKKSAASDNSARVDAEFGLQSPDH